MRRTSWACCSFWLLLALCGNASAQPQHPVRPATAQVLASDSATPPPLDAGWRSVALPHAEPGAAWYRLEFQAPEHRAESWAVYLPYFYAGGALFLNGRPLAEVAQSDGDSVVRWERPFLLPVPDALLNTGANELLIHAAASAISPLARLPALSVGPQAQQLAAYENRRFWARTMPQFTVVACMLVGVLVLFIWWRRREELLYGLFGLAALLWGARTLTFIVEVLPAAWWSPWRMFYHSATGGFVIVLMIFSMRLAGGARPRLERVLLVYWLLGPLSYVAGGGSEVLAGRVWAAGLILIGMGMVVFSAYAAWRHRQPSTTALGLGLAVAVAAGIHDYMLANNSQWLQSAVGHWASQRFFLLHYAADLLLLIMGGILSGRFVKALQDLEHLNRTLESRVAEREQALALKYEQVHRLEKQHAADDERQRIMRDLHDGLGSQLFVTLSRVDAGTIAQDGISQALRDCIADMRLALEAMSPDGNDFLEAWSNFRFRWERQLEMAGLASSWKVETPDGVLALAPSASLQLLRIAQEALTNVLKHASAKHVQVNLLAQAGEVRMEVQDNGAGMPGSGRPGRGLDNMRSRAARLGGGIELEPAHPGTRLRLQFPHVYAPIA
ncbi:MAG: hypothetical protein M3Q12_03250 [Pseudomonadota bacterium]|uniref:sensor histidine kinase n=1 Tax=Polaromonas sp. TaxID=1869339 RepID=UPI0017F45CDF|nr:ATP-binding protein [Polaromonas sp.]MBA3594456.1 hypothetical protein [Polaromonas sp.]MDQ3271172.1 hypothetical protein [Pseudomonadota bacterium]